MHTSTTHQYVRTRPAISPLSAATLLLLVSFVVSSSPNVGGVRSTASDSHAPVGRLAMVVGEERAAARRTVPSQAEQPDRSGLVKFLWATMISPSGVSIGAEDASVCTNHVRTALLNLPPPRA